jgi:hypothetical protein
MAFQALTGHVDKFSMLPRVTSSGTVIICTSQDTTAVAFLKETQYQIVNQLSFNQNHLYASPKICSVHAVLIKNWLERKDWQDSGKSPDPRFEGCATSTLGPPATCVLVSKQL